MSFDLSKFDLDKLKKDATEALKVGLGPLLEGAKEDLKTFGEEIAKDMLKATMAGDEAMQEQLLDQIAVVAEINRVRISNHSLAIVKSVTKAVFKGVVAGATSFI